MLQSIVYNVSNRSSRSIKAKKVTGETKGYTLSQFWLRIRSPEYSEGKKRTRRFKINRRGFFHWNHWDGLLWKVQDVPAFALRKSFLIPRRIEPLLRLIQQRSEPLDRFWVTHFHAVLAVTKSLENLELHTLDLNCVVFLLKTAPKSISVRLSRSTRGLERANFDSYRDVNALRDLRKCIYHRKHNPSFSLLTGKKYRITAEIRDHRYARLCDEKNFRTQVKITSGFDFNSASVSGKRPFNFSRTKDWSISAERARTANEFQNFLDSWPPLWGIEPFSSAMLKFLASVSDSFNTFYKVCNREHNSYDSQSILYRMYINIRTVYELCDDLAALRCYKLDAFPQSTSEKEIQLGKVLWKRFVGWIPSNNYRKLRNKESQQPAIGKEKVKTTKSELRKKT